MSDAHRHDHEHDHLHAALGGEEAGELHAHLHEHADGTVHNHFHRHPGGNLPHSHGVDDKRLILEARDVAYAYPNSAQPVFEGISMKAHAGTVTAILGNNGAGKSTLLNLLGSIIRPTAGSVLVGGRDLVHLGRREIAQHIAYVSQNQRVPHLSVYDEVLLGRKPHVSWSITENDREVVAAAIERLELQAFVDRFCDELSGGERQKVYIARALAQETEMLLLDEPTSALDPKNQVEVLSAVREITKRTELATIMVIHDINLSLRFADRFLLVRNGRVVAQGGPEAVTDETLSETYDMPLRIVDIDGTRMAVMDSMTGR